MTTLHRWFASPIRQRVRRLLVLVTGPLLLVWLVLVALRVEPMTDLLAPIVLIWSLVIVRLGLSTQRLTERHGANLDEREIELRDRIYFRSYQALMVVGLLLLLAVLAAIALDLTVPRSDRVLVTTLAAYVMLVFNLPWALLAWRFPDPVEDEVPLQA